MPAAWLLFNVVSLENMVYFTACRAAMITSLTEG